MTPTLVIASIDALPAALASWRPDLVVSIHSPARPMTRPWPGPWLPLRFRDRETAAWGRIMVAGPILLGMSVVAPLTPAHVEACPGRVLIHCHAGLGRSPATSIVALMAWGMAAPDAVRAVAAALPEASPNRLVLRHAEALLRLSRATTTACRHPARSMAKRTSTRVQAIIDDPKGLGVIQAVPCLGGWHPGPRSSPHELRSSARPRRPHRGDARGQPPR